MSGNGPSSSTIPNPPSGGPAGGPPPAPTLPKFSPEEQQAIDALKAVVAPFKLIYADKQASKDDKESASQQLRALEKEFDNEFKVSTEELSEALKSLHLNDEDIIFFNRELLPLGTDFETIVNQEHMNIKTLEKVRNTLSTIILNNDNKINPKTPLSIPNLLADEERRFNKQKNNLENQIKRNQSAAAKYPDRKASIAANTQQLIERINRLSDDYENIIQPLQEELEQRKTLTSKLNSARIKSNQKRSLLANSKKEIFPKTASASPKEKVEVRENPVFLISDDPKHEIQVEAWKELLGPGYFFDALKEFILLEDETIEDYEDDFIWKQYQNFIVKNNFDEQTLAAIATGYVYNDPGTCVRFSPLKNAKTNDKEKEFFESFLKEVYQSIPELLEQRKDRLELVSQQAVTSDTAVIQQATQTLEKTLARVQPSPSSSSSSSSSPSGLRESESRVPTLKSTPTNSEPEQLIPSTSDQKKLERQAAIERIEEQVERRTRKAFEGATVNPTKRGGDKFITEVTEELKQDLEDALTYTPVTDDDKALHSGYLQTLQTEIDTLKRSISTQSEINEDQEQLIDLQVNLIKQIEQALIDARTTQAETVQRAMRVEQENQTLKQEKGKLETPQTYIQQGDLTTAFQLWSKDHNGQKITLREANALVKSNNKSLLSQVPTVLSKFK